MSQEYGKRIWSGDPTTVAEARARYKADPQAHLIPFAVALYSFRSNKKFTNELLELRPALVDYAQRFMHIPENSQEYADCADILSTHFEWMIRQPRISSVHRQTLHAWVRFLCEKGAYATGRSVHTFCLLKLTETRLYLGEHQYSKAKIALKWAEAKAMQIKDANQRVRVYRKLGLLYRKMHSYIEGYRWGIRACLASDVPTAVRAKSVVALLGIDR